MKGPSQTKRIGGGEAQEDGGSGPGRARSIGKLWGVPKPLGRPRGPETENRGRSMILRSPGEQEGWIECPKAIKPTDGSCGGELP